MYTTLAIPFGSSSRDDQEKVRAFGRLRKTVFMDDLSWDLHSVKDAEWDQYDCSWAVYILIENDETGEIVGGARLLRTDQEDYISQLDEHPTSYMLRDAFLGRLEGLPSSVTFAAPPQDELVWELTRLTATPEVSQMVMRAVDQYLATQGATECLALSTPIVMRIARNMGFSPEPLGAMQSNETGRFQAFRCYVTHDENSLGANQQKHGMTG